MIRTCFLLLCLIECFDSIFAQNSLSEGNPEESLIVQWALQQQLVLNEQPGKTLRLGISDPNDYVVYTYEKLNDSVYLEKVEESSMEFSGSQLYVKRGNQLVPSFLWKEKYIYYNWSGYSDSSGYLVKETLQIKKGDSIKRREVFSVDVNGRPTESWTFYSGTDTLQYTHYSESPGNCHERTVYSIYGTDSVKTIFSHTCLGNGAELLTDKKVFLWSWDYRSPIELLVDEWIMPSGVKHSFDVVDLKSEPIMVNGKLVNNDLTKLRTDKNGFIKRITINDVIVGFNWQEAKK